MNENSKWKLSTQYGFFSIIVSLGLYMIIYTICDFYPVGKFSVLTWDLEAEYATFFAYLRRLLLGQDVTIFSQGISLGANSIGLLASYALSPLNFLLLFFREEHLALGIMLIIILKHGLTALTMYYFLIVKFNDLECSFNEKRKQYLLYAVLSIIYSMSGYAINNQFNLMWLDGMIILPLICAGLEIEERENKKGLAVFSLWMALISNFYIGYMLWIFSFLYFVFIRIENIKNSNWIKKSINYAKTVICAAGLGMILVLPLLHTLSLGNSGENEEGKVLELLKNVNWWKFILVGIGLLCIFLCKKRIHGLREVVWRKCKEYLREIKKWEEKHFVLSLIGDTILILSIAAVALKLINIYEYKGKVSKEVLYLPLKLFLGTFDIDEIIYGLPNIYVSGLIVMMVIYYFLNTEVKLEEKLVQGLLPSIIFVSMFVKNLDYIWHGFAVPHGSRYRYSFLFSFCLILIASNSVLYLWKEERETKKKIKCNVLMGMILSLWIAFSLYKYMSLDSKFLSIDKIVYTVIFYIMIMICFLKRKRTMMLSLMILLVCTELCFNGVLCLKNMSYRDYKDYQQEIVTINEIIGIIKDKDDGVYRIESPDGGVNNGLLYGYDSISHYSSVMPINSVNMLEEFGLKTKNTDNMQAKYNTEINATQAGLLNIKYIYSKKEIMKEGFIEILSYKGYRVYENLEWKQRGFIVAEDKITNSMEDFIEINDFIEQQVEQLNGNRSDCLEYFVVNNSLEDKYLVLSIADDKGWSVTLDGEKANIESAYGTLISIRIPEGEHEVIFQYQVPYLKLGATISILTLICILIANIQKRRKYFVIENTKPLAMLGKSVSGNGEDINKKSPMVY